MIFTPRAGKLILVLSAFLIVLLGHTWAAAEQTARFSDVRWKDGIPSQFGNILKEGTFLQDDIRTFWFNDRVVFEGAENAAAAILEAGKNPGLGVRSLHARGITGKGVRVAIIDQPKPMNHTEYRDKIVDYHNTAGDVYEMHGPAVASLLVGNECGTAPDAKLYYAALASWEGDAGYYADALRWIIARNAELPEGDKIRVVSVSAAPSGPGTPYAKNTEQWDISVAEAKTAGILVLDCREEAETNITFVGYYDLDNPDDLSRFTTGSPKYDLPQFQNRIYVPASCRTQAEEYSATENHWQYTGDGGMSWTTPYLAGVLAMGWQIDPSLTNDKIISVLRETAYVNSGGYRIINPVAFIEAIENPQSNPDPTPQPDSGSDIGGGCSSMGFTLMGVAAVALFFTRKAVIKQ